MALWIGFAVFEVIGVACVAHLWARRPARSVGQRLFWSVACLVPLVGPLAYGALYRPPSLLTEGEQARENRDAMYGH